MTSLTSIVREFISRGIILNSEATDSIKNLSVDQQEELALTLSELPDSDLERIKGEEHRFIGLFRFLDHESFFLRKAELAKRYGRSFFDDFLGYLEQRDMKKNWDIVFSYEEHIKKRTYDDFVRFYRNRYRQMSEILKSRYELRDAVPARRILQREGRERVSYIGMVTQRRETKNGNIVIVAEDQTGQLTLIAHNSKPDLLKDARELSLDEVVGFRGMRSSDAIFLDDIIWPDVPVDTPMRYASDDVSALFISDVQYGRQFLHEEFEEFITWINRDELASKVRYLFIVGDMVDGIGIFPSQYEELDVKDIYEQFEHVARYLERIPDHITIFICPGNHDPVRLAEPQPVLPSDIAASLYALDNVVMVSNPAIISVEGIEVLLYHGYSFDHYAQTIDSIRNAGGYDAPIEIMKYLLKRRHLAPTHASTLFIPDIRKDYHVIERVPDIFATGHLHRMQAGSYRSTTLLQCGGWMGKTPFEEKLGHNPVPGKAWHVDLRTRKVSQIDFVTPQREKILKEKGWI